MRLRWQRRVHKQLRNMRGPHRSLPAVVARLERTGLPLDQALRSIALDHSYSYFDRAIAGRLLSIDGDDRAVEALLQLFFEQTKKDDLYATALTLESLNDRRAVRPLIHALLEDENQHRKHAAARALGWITQSGRSAALALAQCLSDASQPHAVREEAAESLAYAGNAETIEALISAIGDADVRIRFWAVFGLGQSCRGEERAVRALESVLGDTGVPPGNWWSVGKEALGVLGSMRRPAQNHKVQLKSEVERVLSDVNAPPEDRRWAEWYGWSARNADSVPRLP